MTEEYNIKDVVEVLSTVAVGIGEMNSNMRDISNAVGLIATNSQELTEIKHRLSHLTETSEQIASAFVFDQKSNKAGALYHMAGSLNSIKFALPGYSPNPQGKQHNQQPMPTRDNDRKRGVRYTEAQHEQFRVARQQQYRPDERAIDQPVVYTNLEATTRLPETTAQNLAYQNDSSAPATQEDMYSLKESLNIKKTQ